MYEKLTKCLNLHDSCPKKLAKYPNFLFAQNINKIPKFYMIFDQKVPKFYIIIAQKIFFPEFFLGGT